MMSERDTMGEIIAAEREDDSAREEGSASQELLVRDQRSTAIIDVRNIVKVFRSHGTAVRALDGVNLRVQPGQRVVLAGRSGSGKTTLLRCLNVLEEPTAGEFRFDGELFWKRTGADVLAPSRSALRRHRMRVGMVFQRFELFPHLSVRSNVTLGLRRVLHMPRKQAEEWAMQQLELVGLAERARSHPHELSGGQQQRVAIARSLAMKPEVMLFDEPTSALDPELVAEVLNVMIDLAAAGMTMVVVTHELAFARDVADSMHIFADGKIIEQGTPDEVIHHPRSARTESLLRRLRMA